MKPLIRKIFEKSSFHGFAYIARRDIHWLEKILWSTILLFGSYCSVNICYHQWDRYKENPTVFGFERIMGTKEFPFMGVTMCSNYFDMQQAEIIIKNTWKTDPNDDKFAYYMEFLQVISTVRYDNLEILQPYQNDSTVVDIPFLEIIWDIRSTLFSNTTMRPGKDEPIGGSIIVYGTSEDRPDRVQPQFNNVITEVGMCVTTSNLYEYQNPLGFKREPKKVTNGEMCSPFDMCHLKIKLSAFDGDKSMTYVHNNEDIIPQDDKDVIKKLNMTMNTITQIEVQLELMTAEKEVRNVPIKYRKCRFTDENNLKYFKTYRPILCRNECRINAALRLCKCKPFFYVVGPPGPICTTKGMLCLAKVNWKDTKCEECIELCSVRKYTELKALMHDYAEVKFESSVMIKLSLPKIGVRRRVVFSTDQLVVAFGGAASLFLGCSFLSFAQILYYCLQSLELKIKHWGRRLK